MQAATLPSACASSVKWPFSRAEIARWRDLSLALFLPGRASRYGPSAVGKERSEFAFQVSAVSQSELDRHIVKPSRREAAVEMPHARRDHATTGTSTSGRV